MNVRRLTRHEERDMAFYLRFCEYRQHQKMFSEHAPNPIRQMLIYRDLCNEGRSSR